MRQSGRTEKKENAQRGHADGGMLQARNQTYNLPAVKQQRKPLRLMWIHATLFNMTSRDLPSTLAKDVSVAFLSAGKPRYIHLGEEVDGVDMRAEVGLLSRNILVRGEMETGCYGNEACKFFDFDTFGGHLKVRQQADGDAQRTSNVV